MITVVIRSRLDNLVTPVADSKVDQADIGAKSCYVQDLQAKFFDIAVMRAAVSEDVGNV